jgi:hypothetical protein
MSERERYWRGVLEQWRVSGLTRLGFCRLQGISYGTLNRSHREGPGNALNQEQNRSSPLVGDDQFCSPFWA